MPTDEHWKKAQEIFDRIRSAPPECRAAELRAACGGDDVLWAEVESLLEHDSQAGETFLASSAARRRKQVGALESVSPGEAESSLSATSHAVNCTAANIWAEKLVSSVIGRYRLRRLIAFGGMGCVFEATQERPSRAVALKILPPGSSAPAALARFRIEPEILGRLQHPNIAQVYEAGIHESEYGGLPYFAMELIPGAQSLIAYSDARRLSLRQRLELFGKVCDGVHHGHQKGIIHRDLKPANILVGADGEPKVIDFGVARASDADIVLTTQCTHTGDLIGTVRYMSPEQCDGDPARIDTRSDIYALGVVLYELLTGAAPYDTSGTTVYRAIRIIKDVPPRRPSELNRSLRGDLDAILLKALEKEAGRRYVSAADLAQDVRRYLAGEPIEARSPGRWLRLTRWIGRRPLVATAAASALMLALTVAGSNAFVWWYLLRPDAIELDADQREARLIALSGKPIHTWRAPGNGRIASAQMSSRPAEFGGGTIALLMFNTDEDGTTGGALCAYDVENPAKPIWSRRLEENEVPDTLRLERNVHASSFHYRPLGIEDIFPGAASPGHEIIVTVQGRPLSASVIRIHNLNGDLLYQIWQDGGVRQVYWMKDAGLLVCLGANGVAYWEHRGQRSSRRCPTDHPLVVFAIRPKLGFITDDCLRETPRAGDDADPLHPEWCYCIWPPDFHDWIEPGDSLSVMLDDPAIGERGRVVGIGINVNEVYKVGISWMLDEHGQLVPGGRVVVGNPAAAGDELPDLSMFDLRPLPPIIGYEDDPPCLTPPEFWNNRPHSP